VSSALARYASFVSPAALHRAQAGRRCDPEGRQPPGSSPAFSTLAPECITGCSDSQGCWVHKLANLGMQMVTPGSKKLARSRKPAPLPHAPPVAHRSPSPQPDWLVKGAALSPDQLRDEAPRRPARRVPHRVCEFGYVARSTTIVRGKSTASREVSTERRFPGARRTRPGRHHRGLHTRPGAHHRASGLAGQPGVRTRYSTGCSDSHVSRTSGLARQPGVRTRKSWDADAHPQSRAVGEGSETSTCDPRSPSCPSSQSNWLA